MYQLHVKIGILYKILLKTKKNIGKWNRMIIVRHGQSNLKREADDSIPRKINERLIRNDRVLPDANRNESTMPGN